MSTITRTYTFTDGTTAYGSQVDSEIANIVNVFNNHDAGSSTWTVTSSSLFKAANGSASSPVYTFSGETTTGLFFAGSGIVGISLVGTDTYEFSATKIVPSVDNTNDLGSTALGWKHIYMKNGSASLPSYTFRDNSTTGWYISGTNEMSATTNATQALIIDVNQDVYSTTFTDYSSTSTIVGWGSFTTKQVFYKKVGKTMTVWYRLVGTSNSTSITFTLPFSNNSSIVVNANVSQAIDNTNTNAPGALLQMATGGSTATLFVDSGGTGWTNTGTKNVSGQFSYQTA